LLLHADVYTPGKISNLLLYRPLAKQEDKRQRVRRREAGGGNGRNVIKVAVNDTT